jgi:hypothetical protein
MERIPGYLVGKDPVRGVMTWVVKINDEKNPSFGKKLLVASTADGVALSGGLSVDFIIGDRNGSPVAVDVAPRGIKEQGRKDEMKRSKWLVRSILTLILLTVATFAVSIYQGPIGSAVADTMIRYSMTSALARVEKMPFQEMVTGETVAKVVKDQHVGVYAGKSVLLERELCLPVFGELYTGNRCWWALYYSHGADGTPNEAYAKRGIPDTSGPVIDGIRNAMLEKAREYLRDPQRLKAFYESMKQSAVSAYRSLPAEHREVLATRLDGVVRAFEHFYDPDVQVLYAEYSKANAAWWTSPRGVYGSEVDRKHMELFKAMRVEEDKLRELSPDFHSTLMAGRRHVEGGKELVAMWIWVLKDAQASIK